ncbi:cystathionine gamma-lyase [Rhodococcus opacus]|uniref:cystathionine gamma-lyase n=1 Tax=Rhodococcus TaxID=1827 RepID=UPI0002A24A6B|nr:cystathionine gamma-lyase [Rhodococcus opacus]ELB94328.1 cystathionine gamma-lyase [Rhodococcus wratislaviensis IFP 2016]NHU41311.1 cystathionine gamma-lyase [Rhodococcus sp. A14]MBA8960417.1 cystathionine gamma-lyase [Rhodococcus opacus]MBP2205982.1 cystathionine gamma-lyase [Rhodococcus opacus]MDJ0416236.1 cystathionine gamma-lyase [Rhodococcus opacus]
MSGDSTRCVKAVAAENVPGSPMQRGPVFAAPYQLSADEGTESDTYARASNPGWRDLESALATLEGAAGALVVGSGMSAVTVVLRSLLTAGDTVVVPSDGYYQVRAYARERLEPMGITVHELRTADMAGEAAAALLASAEGTTVVVAETPANPSLDVVDLRTVSEQCANAGAVLVVDNTTATPLGQQPLELGADVVVASGTKTLSGHSDLLMGYIAASDADFLAGMERERALSGTVLGPFETWLAHRSLGTAGLRFERQCANALALAALLESHPAAHRVRYPGLPEDPAHAVAAGQMRRFGGLVSFEVDSAEQFHRLVAGSELLVPATSFGGIHTSADRRARWGDPVPDGFVRISCGIEDTEDLVADLEQALSAL